MTQVEERTVSLTDAEIEAARIALADTYCMEADDETNPNAATRAWRKLRAALNPPAPKQMKGQMSVEDCIAEPHVEGRERESKQLARVGGKNVSEGLKQGSKARPQEGPLTPTEWRRRVFERQRAHPHGPALCAVTGQPLNLDLDDCHHVLEIESDHPAKAAA